MPKALVSIIDCSIDPDREITIYEIQPFSTSALAPEMYVRPRTWPTYATQALQALLGNNDFFAGNGTLNTDARFYVNEKQGQAFSSQTKFFTRANPVPSRKTPTMDWPPQKTAAESQSPQHYEIQESFIYNKLLQKLWIFIHNSALAPEFIIIHLPELRTNSPECERHIKMFCEPMLKKGKNDFIIKEARGTRGRGNHFFCHTLSAENLIKDISEELKSSIDPSVILETCRNHTPADRPKKTYRLIHLALYDDDDVLQETRLIHSDTDCSASYNSHETISQSNYFTNRQYDFNEKIIKDIIEPRLAYSQLEWVKNQL